MSLGADRFIVSRTSKNGRRTFSTVYTPEQYLNWTIVEIIMVLILAFCFSPLVSAFFLVLYPFHRHEKSVHVVGIIASGYLLFDLHKEWILWIVYKIFADPKDFALIKYGNIACLASHITFLIFDELFDYLSAKSELILLFYVAGVTYFYYLIAQSLF